MTSQYNPTEPAAYSVFSIPNLVQQCDIALHINRLQSQARITK